MLRNLIFTVVLGIILSGCINKEVYDEQDRYLDEVAKIDAYLDEQNIEAEVDPATGIRYVVHDEGTGLRPYLVDSVTMDVTGTILNGDQFTEETAIKEKWAALIDGAVVALNKIQEGGRVTAYIPSYYAYGPQKNGEVPANSILVMDYHLIEAHARQLKKEIAAIDDSLAAWGIQAIEHPSGIRYVKHVAGSGKFPTQSSNITVNYEGRLLGKSTKFDAGDSRSFQLSQLVFAWKLILPLVKEESEITIYTPSAYAYGWKGSGSIPPYATLEFDIDLLSVQ